MQPASKPDTAGARDDVFFIIPKISQGAGLFFAQLPAIQRALQDGRVASFKGINPSCYITGLDKSGNEQLVFHGNAQQRAQFIHLLDTELDLWRV